jgi:hypothetical protein
MTDPIDRLAASDPARALPAPEPDMALFERLVATSPAPRRAPRPDARRALLGGTAALVVAVAIVIAGFGSTADRGMDLAAKAYAAAAPNSNAVTHSVSVSVQIVRPRHPRGRQSVWRTTTRRDRWLYRDRSHTILTYDGKTYDQVLGADGVLRNRLPSGEVQTMRVARKPGESSEIVGSAKTDPVAAFRQQFAAGHLRDAGPVTFAGRAAHAYQRTTAVALPRRMGRQVTTETFYLAVPAGVPVGMRRRIVNVTGTVDEITTLTRFEHLPATAANLAHVAG